MKIIIPSYILVVLSLNFSAQTNSENLLTPFAQVGIVAGGSMTSNNFNFSSGEMFQLGVMKPISEKLNMGFSVGLENLDNDRFYPFALRFEANVFKNDNFKYLAQIGYSHAEYINQSEVENLELKGGLFMEIGRLWCLDVGDNLELMSSLSVKYQFAELEFESFNNEITEKIDYMRIGFSLGLRLK